VYMVNRNDKKLLQPAQSKQCLVHKLVLLMFVLVYAEVAKHCEAHWTGSNNSA
jgi:hypothetical protein